MWAIYFYSASGPGAGGMSASSTEIHGGLLLVPLATPPSAGWASSPLAPPLYAMRLLFRETGFLRLRILQTHPEYTISYLYTMDIRRRRMRTPRASVVRTLELRH